MKGKQVETSSSSSSSSEYEDEDEDDEHESDDQASTSSFDNEEVMQLIGVKRMLHKMRAKGVPVTIEDIMFTNQRRRQRKNGCFGSKKGHFVEDCPNKPTSKAKKKACKVKALTTIKTWEILQAKKK